jgi:hypothetical protein
MPELRAAEHASHPHLIPRRANAHVSRTPRTLRGLRRLGSRHPEWWLLPAAAAAWVLLAAQPHPQPHAHAGHGGAAHGASVDVLGLAAMIVAMMLPLVIPDVRNVVRVSPWRRRYRAIAAFVAAYLAVWMLAMLVIDAAWRLAASRVESATAAAGVMIVAVMWEIAWANRHHSAHPPTTPRAARGWRADAGCVRAGALTGGRCVAACWALMAACVAFAHSLPVMIGIFVVQLGGRYRQAVRTTVLALVRRRVAGTPRLVNGGAAAHQEA